MQTWHLTSGQPLQLVVAADARLDPVDYCNDQIWELKLDGGEPSALALQTTYGLRAHWMRLFPAFLQKGQPLTDPKRFYQPPQVSAFYPNYLAVNCFPYNGIELLLEYWAAGSQVVCGKMQITNRKILPERIRLEWAALLNPLEGGQNMAPVSFGNQIALQGQSDHLTPVCLLNGMPQAGKGSFPALGSNFDLLPGNSHSVYWALASLPSAQASYELAKATLARPWEAEMARIELNNQASLYEIHTDNPEWDAALAFSQKTAKGLILPAGELPAASFATTRQPDQGFSPRGDGNDYPASWSGPTALDTWYLTYNLSSAEGSMLRGFVDNFLSSQSESGQIDGKPGPAGQRQRQMAQPLLSSLAWKAQSMAPDQAWLGKVYPGLVNFVRQWSSPAYDHDGDGLPDWETPYQSGLVDNLVYKDWLPEEEGQTFILLDQMALLVMLYQEFESLLKIARQTGQTEDVPWLEERAASLREVIQSAWTPQAHTYRAGSLSLPRTQRKRRLAEFNGSGEFELKHTFKKPQRVAVHLDFEEEVTLRTSVVLYGRNQNGDVVEEMPTRRFYYSKGHAYCTSQNQFLALERIEIKSLMENDQLWITTLDTTQSNISLLLPLWAKTAEPEQAVDIIQNVIQPDYLQAGGLPLMPPRNRPDDPVNLACVSLPWNTLVIEGLLHYGQQKLAADLFTRLAQAVCTTLKQNQTFRQLYHAESLLPYGEQQHLYGLLPVELFLKIAGIVKISQQEVILHGILPFSGQITVKYLGVMITRSKEETNITFPNGQNVKVTTPGSYRVYLPETPSIKEAP
jgi:hypothetical protein